MEIGIGLGITRFPGWGVIGQLFASGEQGAWYDPSDMSTLFQDSAGTVPVTAVEHPVGRILDKSGRGNHATQATTTKRPVLKIDAGGCYYLSFDGVDDALQTGNINFTSTDKMTVWAGVTKLSDAANALVYEFSSTESLNVGSFSMWAPINLGAVPLGATAKGATSRSVAATSGFSGVASGVVAQDISLSAPRNALRVNGATLSTETTALGGSFGNYPLYIGARAGDDLYFNGRLYSLIVRGAQSSLSQIEATEAYIKQKMRLP